MDIDTSTTHWIDAPGGRLFARCWRPQAPTEDPVRKPPIVLFHDSLGCVELWRGFPLRLADRAGRLVIAYDRLGFGGSDPRTAPPGPRFIQDEAERFFPALRAGLGFDRFVAFGHSVGGAMAAHCAARHPSACEALVTESAQFFVEDRTRSGILQAKEQFKTEASFERLRRLHGEKARWVLDAWADTWLSPEFADWTLEEALAQVACPTLVIHGSEDEYGSLLHPRQIADRVAGVAQLEILPGVRHVPHREREAWVAQRVAGFLLEPPIQA